MLEICLYKYSVDQRCLPKILSYVLTFIPLDKSIQFHKLIAFLIFIGSIMHPISHINNYYFVPITYEKVYGMSHFDFFVVLETWGLWLSCITNSMLNVLRVLQKLWLKVQCKYKYEPISAGCVLK